MLQRWIAGFFPLHCTGKGLSATPCRLLSSPHLADLAVVWRTSAHSDFSECRQCIQCVRPFCNMPRYTITDVGDVMRQCVWLQPLSRDAAGFELCPEALTGEMEQYLGEKPAGISP